MGDKRLFDVVHKNINKCEIRLENYIIPSPRVFEKAKGFVKFEKSESDIEHHEVKENNDVKKTSRQISKEEVQHLQDKAAIKATLEKFSAFADEPRDTKPKLCLWTYMVQTDIENLLSLTNKRDIRTTIDNNMKLDYPKGISRLLTIELLYSVVRFCQKSRFNAQQVGALLSIFYLTHQYFLSSYNRHVHETYTFFKEHMLLHCLECPPDSMLLFNYNESKHIALYFCTLYLRNLPLIRLLTLPNFGFYLNYERPPDLFVNLKKGKGQKDKKDKKGKKGK